MSRGYGSPAQHGHKCQSGLVALPILAPVVLPLIAEDMDGFVMISVPKPPPLPTLKPAAAAVNPNAAPVAAPSAITKETGLEAGFEDVAGVGDAGIVGVGGSLEYSLVAPVDPPIAQAARVQGIVILEATIGADGQVLDARVMRSVPLLDQSALDAVRQWQFSPTLLNGVPVPVVMTVTVSFVLR